MNDVDQPSAEEWAHELHYMAKAGFDDLYHVSLGVDQEGQPYENMAETITAAFELVVVGMELPRDDLATNLAEFLKASERADPEGREELMRLALANLSAALGFAIGP